MATASATSLTFSDLIYVIFVTVWIFVAIFYKHAHSLWSSKDNQINCKPCTYLENGQGFAVQRRQQRQQQQRQLNVIAFSLLKIPRRALTR